MVKAAALAADQRAVETTPADTGQARSNWITTVDTEFTGTIPPYAPGSKLGMGERANLDGAVNQGKVAIASFALPKSQRIIIQNNLPYIGGLNDGTISRQSSNMVELGAQAAVIAARSVRIFLD